MRRFYIKEEGKNLLEIKKKDVPLYQDDNNIYENVNNYNAKLNKFIPKYYIIDIKKLEFTDDKKRLLRFFKPTIIIECKTGYHLLYRIKGESLNYNSIQYELSKLFRFRVVLEDGLMKSIKNTECNIIKINRISFTELDFLFLIDIAKKKNNRRSVYGF